MLGTPLAALGGLSTVDLVFAVAEALSVVLGLTISYIAYRGYRRNDARPMLFVSVGFLLVLGVPAVAAGFWVFVPAVHEIAAGAVTQVFELVGLACILYGLRLSPE